MKRQPFNNGKIADRSFKLNNVFLELRAYQRALLNCICRKFLKTHIDMTFNFMNNWRDDDDRNRNTADLLTGNSTRGETTHQTNNPPDIVMTNGSARRASQNFDTDNFNPTDPILSGDATGIDDQNQGLTEGQAFSCRSKKTKETSDPADDALCPRSLDDRIDSHGRAADMLALPTPDVKLERNPDDLVPLKNLGNTCYMNSTVQSLFVLSFFFNFLKEKFEALQGNTESSFRMTVSLLSVYNEYLVQKNSTITNDNICTQLRELKDAVGDKSGQFRSNMQQDAAEFLQLILGTVDEEFEKAKVRAEDNPVQKFFEIELDSHLKCLKCDHNLSLPKQKSLIMYLSLPKDAQSVEISLQNAVIDFFNEEKLEHKCEQEGCDGTQKIRTTQALRLPPVLCIQLGRYTEDGSKRQETVSVPNEITVPVGNTGQYSLKSETYNEASQGESNEVTQAEASTESAYQLVAAICHYGGSLMGGHYVSFAFQQENNTWYHCDDDVITWTSIEKAQDGMKTSGYCFFYVNKSLV